MVASKAQVAEIDLEAAALTFDSFTAELRRVWDETPAIEDRMGQAREVLWRTLGSEVLRGASADWPCTDGGLNLLLYEDEEHGFVVNAVVRTPNRTGSVHDHASAWVLYGVLVGKESLERYERLDDGSDPARAVVRQSGVSFSGPATVDLVPPFEIHAEQGGPERSVALIIRSHKLGKEMQGRYDLQTGTRREGTGPRQVPYSVRTASVLESE